MNVRQAVVAALEFVGQFSVIDTQQVQQRRMQVMDVDFVFSYVVANFVCRSDRLSGLDATTRHPHRERFHMVVSAHQVARFALRRPTKLAAPDDDGTVE